MVQSKLLLKFKEIEHYFFDKYDLQNEKFFSLIKKSIIANQAHGNKVIYLKQRKTLKICQDGIVTDKNLTIGVKTADCLPILLFDTRKKITGAIHAGWRGLLSGIIINSIKKISALGAESKNVTLAIGPHIRSCCYQVSEDFFDKFVTDKNKNQIIKSRQKKIYLDLEKIALLQLLDLGILKKNIDIIDICTYCDKRFFSYRREGKINQRMYSIIRKID